MPCETKSPSMSSQISFFLKKRGSRDKIYGELEKWALITKVIWFNWLITWIWEFLSSNYLEWPLHCKLDRFTKFLKLDLMRSNSCIVWVIGRWFKMSWIYSLNWSLGLNNLIWREIRSRLKAKSKIGLYENFRFSI